MVVKEGCKQRLPGVHCLKEKPLSQYKTKESPLDVTKGESESKISDNSHEQQARRPLSPDVFSLIGLRLLFLRGAFRLGTQREGLNPAIRKAFGRATPDKKSMNFEISVGWGPRVGTLLEHCPVD